MEYRKIFDTIPDAFDRWRPRYCSELFASLITAAKIGLGKTVLEIGPGTGQATDPILKTGCDYHAVELGEHGGGHEPERMTVRDGGGLRPQTVGFVGGKGRIAEVQPDGGRPASRRRSPCCG